MTAVTSAPPSVGMGAINRITIEYWNQNTDRLGGPAVAQLIKQFNDTNSAITVVQKTYPTDTEVVQALQTALAGKTQPAIVQVSFGYLRYVAGNLPHLTIDDAAKRDVQGKGTEWLSQNFAANILDLGRVDSVLHGMPYGYSIPLIFYNPDLFKAAGLERPATTWADVRTQAQQITQRTGKTGIYVSESSAWIPEQILTESNGAQTLIGTGTDVRCGVDSPEAIEAIQLYADMVLKDKSSVHMPQQQGQTSFISGQIGMYALQFTSNLESIRQFAAFSLGTAAIPTFGGKRRRLGVGGNTLFILATDPAQQTTAWEWIKYLNSPESLTAYVKGSGFFPTRLHLSDDSKYLKPYFDGNQLLQPALDEVTDVVPWVSFPGKNGLQVNQELIDARAKILDGSDVTVTLRDVTQRANQLIRG